MLPFQYQRFCLVESLTVIQNPHLMTSDSSGELDGHDANEQQMVLLLMIQYSGHRNSKWFRPHAQLDHHDTMWIWAQWPQHMKYVARCTAAACINRCDHVTSWGRSSDAMELEKLWLNPNTISFPWQLSKFHINWKNEFIPVRIERKILEDGMFVQCSYNLHSIFLHVRRTQYIAPD